jgi:Skp family chaperone for outer membrane proteins
MITRKVLLLLIITIGASISVFAQPRPTPTPARPTPTPARPTATPVRPTATPTPTPTPARPATTQPQANLTVAVPASRVAVIDTEMFSDEKAGIYRLIDANKIVQNEFRARQQELEGLQTRLVALVEDIRKLRAAGSVVDQKAIQAKQDEGTRLQQDFETRKQRFQEDSSKRYREVTGPITELIGKALDEFARQNGITMTLDLSKLLPAVLTALPTTEVTEAFIADFNRKNPRIGPPTKP